MNQRHQEAAFESIIEAHLLTDGYTAIAPSAYDFERALFPDITLAFIRTSPPKEWAKLEALHGANTEATVLKDLAHWLDTYGTLAVLRNGFKCYGRTGWPRCTTMRTKRYSTR